MIQSCINAIKVAGVAASVPQLVREKSAYNALFGEDLVAKISEHTGVFSQHVSDGTICTSDLCCDAARRLLAELCWDPADIGILLLVTQSADYISPATSFPLHKRLGLSKQCAVFDINLGCSGYVYGLWTLSSLMACSNAKRGLLLVGETNSRLNSPLDRTAALLVGDAGTATALEKDTNAEPAFFVLGSDGGGYKHLMTPAGGMRKPHTPETLQRVKHPDGSFRSEGDAYMNGAEVFTFTLREVPTMFHELREFSQTTDEDVDHYVLHQANRFMLNHLMAKLKLPERKVPIAIGHYGNTSSASIPLTMCAALREAIAHGKQRLVLAGFGVGFSWAAVNMSIGPACVPVIGSVEKVR